MSQPPASSSMANRHPTTTSLSNYKVIFESALKQYHKTTKQDLTTHPITRQLQAHNSPTAILTILQDQVDQFTQSRSGDEGLMRWLNPTVNVLCAFSACLSAVPGEGGDSGFFPTNAIFAGVGVLFLVAKDVEASQYSLVDFFEPIEHFFRRLESYTEVPPTPAMTEIMVKIMVEVLDILGTATKEMQQSRAKKFLRQVARTRKIEDGLKRLDRMTEESVRMAIAEVLTVTHSIDQRVQAIDEKVQGIKNSVQGVGEMLITVDEKVNTVDDIVRGVDNMVQGVDLKVQTVIDAMGHMRRQSHERLRKWQSPPDPSINHDMACDCQHSGTTEWFLQGSVFNEWKVTGSLLWIHGKPGSGKSVLCSAIIQDITTLHEAGSAVMAYFYFDVQDINKRSRHNLLSSLLVQLSACSDIFCDVLSRLYGAHNDGACQPSDSALLKCLKEMLTNQVPIYLILDGLDECPNTGVPSSREEVLELVKELVGLCLPSLHICVTSRPVADIQDALERLISHSVSLHDESGQKKDIAEYVRSVVYSSSGLMRRWRRDDKEYVIRTLLERADGMFRWVFCQLETLRHCFPSNIRRILKELPASLEETYQLVLKEIGRANRLHVYRLLQCLTVAIRPLRVEELAEILVFDLDGAKKGLKKGWRWKSQQEAVLSTCSSLLAIVEDGPHRVVQFSHFSVKEFLTSDHLASSGSDVSHFHILLEPAHTVIAKVCLGILLQSDNSAGNVEAKTSSHLLKYAAEHWVEHAQFKEVSTHLQVTMETLFDPAMPYFESWLESYDIDQGWDGFTTYDKQRGSPLYYASLCGFRDLVAHLVAKHPQHVNATLGRCHTPLAAALHKRHFDIAELLYQHGAAVDIRGYKNRTLLHAASVGGFADVASWLLNHCVDVHSQQDDHETPLHLARTNGSEGHYKNLNVNSTDDANHTPLHLASLYGRFETVRLLINHGAEVTSQDREYRAPLHLASSSGSAGTVPVLIEHGADVNARDGSHNTPLHLASSSGSPETVRILVESGADITSQDQWHQTPLHLASSLRRPETVQVLIELGADVNARDGSHDTPLHLASSSGSPETVQLLIELGANVNAMGGSHNSPLHLASSLGSPETVLVLLQHGADVNALGGSHNTPLHLASSSQCPDIVRLLIDHGAEVTSQDRWNWTPLHMASSSGSPEIVQILLERGADLDGRDGNHKTPLHLASSSGSPETVKLLIDYGADFNARDGNHDTPLHLASFSWSPETVRPLIESGADVNVKDRNHKTPLHLASSSRSSETVRILIDYGADVNSRDEDHNAPLHLVASSPSPKAVQLLIDHGADVDAKDGNHNTPLHLALSSWRPEIVRLLLRHGADANALDGSHKTPLHLASSQDETPLNQTEIRRVKSDEKADIVQLLIQHRADVTARDDTGSTPLHMASFKGSGKTVKLLLGHGAEINAQDGKRSTPLHQAASSRSASKGDVIHLLLSHGAYIFAKDNEGMIPIQIGSSRGISKITEPYQVGGE